MTPTRQPRANISPLVWLVFCVSALLTGCGQSSTKPTEVVVYTALDRQMSEPILVRFEKETGVKVRPVYDAEAVKTVGLVNRLLAERNRPVADVFWNNEPMRSIDLAQQGLAEPYKSPQAEGIPSAFKDPDGLWTGFAARARVIIVNTRLIPDTAGQPTRVEDLIDPKWKGRACFAKPLFGTTATQAAAMWARDAKAAEAFWTAAKANAAMLAGNAMVRDAVANGEYAWGLTDTDDAVEALMDGKPVRIVYPKGGPEGSGALLIPNSLMLVKGGPNPEGGKKLIDYLLSAPIEEALAKGRGAQVPLRPGLPWPSALPLLEPDAILNPDWKAVHRGLAPSREFLATMVGS